MAFYQEKLDLALDCLKENKIDMWIVAGHESATNSEPILSVISDHEFIGYTALVFCADGSKYCVCTPIDANGYIHAGVFDEVYPFNNSFQDELAKVIKMKNPRVIALDYSENDPGSDGLSYGAYLYIQEAFALSGFKGGTVSAYPITSVVRAVKSDWEIARIKKSCAVAEEIFDAAKDYIKAGVTCLDVFNFFQAEVEKRGIAYAWAKSFNPGVFAGKDCPSGHMAPPPIEIKAGHLVNVDFGVKIDEYSCDLQRMYYLLREGETDAPEDAKAAFYAVRDGIARAAAFMKPGVSGNQVDTVAREYITGLGYEDWNSATGHGMGREAHDGGPVLGPRKPRYNRPELIDTPLREGYVFTLEPGVFTAYGRVGLEEDVVIRKDAAEFLTPPQQELYLIPFKR